MTGIATAVPRINEMARATGERLNARSFTAIPPADANSPALLFAYNGRKHRM
jgi:hypothetical protein